MHAFRSILLAITKQHTTEMELRQAFRLAADNRAKLLIALFDTSLETMHRFQFLPLEEKLESIFRSQLEDELIRLRTMAWDEGIRAETRIVAGRPRQTIHEIIREYEIDLVVKLADASGALARNQLTGNDLALLRKCPVPLLMMADRNQLPNFNGKIMVALDVGDPDSDALELNKKLLRYGIYLASQEQAELHLVSVWGIPLSKRLLQTLSDEEIYELQEITRARYQHKQEEVMREVGLHNTEPQFRVQTHLLKGKPSTEIQKMANEANVDLIVMGTLGRHNKGILIGNTAENILNGIYCSILAIKPEGYTYPLANVVG